MQNIEKKSKKIAKTKLPALKTRFSQRLMQKGNPIMCVGEKMVEQSKISGNHVSEKILWQDHLKKTLKKIKSLKSFLRLELKGQKEKQKKMKARGYSNREGDIKYQENLEQIEKIKNCDLQNFNQQKLDYFLFLKHKWLAISQTKAILQKSTDQKDIESLNYDIQEIISEVQNQEKKLDFDPMDSLDSIMSLFCFYRLKFFQKYSSINQDYLEKNMQLQKEKNSINAIETKLKNLILSFPFLQRLGFDSPISGDIIQNKQLDIQLKISENDKNDAAKFQEEDQKQFEKLSSEIKSNDYVAYYVRYVSNDIYSDENMPFSFLNTLLSLIEQHNWLQRDLKEKQKEIHEKILRVISIFSLARQNLDDTKLPFCQMKSIIVQMLDMQIDVANIVGVEFKIPGVPNEDSNQNQPESSEINSDSRETFNEELLDLVEQGFVSRQLCIEEIRRLPNDDLQKKIKKAETIRYFVQMLRI